MGRLLREIYSSAKKILLTAFGIFVVLALFFDFALHKCPTTGGFFDPKLSCEGTYYEPFQITSDSFMLWFALTGIPLVLLWMAVNVSKNLWLDREFIPRSRYYRIYRRVIFSVEVFLSLFVALVAYPYLVMHSEQISSFFVGAVVKWVEPWYDVFMNATMAGFAYVFSFLIETLVKWVIALQSYFAK